MASSATPSDLMDSGDPSDRTGTPAVPFELADTDGAVHRLADYTEDAGAGRWLLLVFHRHLA